MKSVDIATSTTIALDAAGVLTALHQLTAAVETALRSIGIGLSNEAQAMLLLIGEDALGGMIDLSGLMLGGGMLTAVPAVAA